MWIAYLSLLGRAKPGDALGVAVSALGLIIMSADLFDSAANVYGHENQWVHWTVVVLGFVLTVIGWVQAMLPDEIDKFSPSLMKWWEEIFTTIDLAIGFYSIDKLLRGQESMQCPP